MDDKSRDTADRTDEPFGAPAPDPMGMHVPERRKDTLSAGPAPPDVIRMFGMNFTNVSFEELCEQLDARVERRTPGFIVTPNVDHVCMVHETPRFQEAYARASLVLADGMPIMWAARMLGNPLKQKLSGSDLVPALAKFAAQRGHSVFFLGGAPGTASRTAHVLKERNPSLKIAGVNEAVMGFDTNPRALQAVVEHIRGAKPDICFVALGSPKQEIFLSHYVNSTNVPISIGVGASFDFLSGRARRAPAWVQQAGFEWFWRLSMEPRRLWKRYLVDDAIFFRLLWLEFRKRLYRRLPHFTQ